MTITIPAWSCLALNPFGGFTIAWRHFAAWNKHYVLLGVDEYAEQITEQMIDERIRNYPFNIHVIRARTDKVIASRASHLAFQTIYIYSDVVASQVVRDVWANFLRVITPKGSHADLISENFFYLFYNDIGIKSFNTIEILLRGDTCRPIPFLRGVVEVT